MCTNSSRSLSIAFPNDEIAYTGAKCVHAFFAWVVFLLLLLLFGRDESGCGNSYDDFLIFFNGQPLESIKCKKEGKKNPSLKCGCTLHWNISELTHTRQLPS